MAELPKDIRRPGGDVVSPKRPHGPRLLLPAEIELCKAIGASEEEYWFFADQTASYNGKRPEAYDLIPDIKAGFLPPLVAAGGGLTWLGQVAVGVALSAVSYLITPKPKEPKQGTSKRTADAIGNKKFVPQFEFNSIQELAELGNTIPLVFANETGDGYGGIRVNSMLLWSQMLSLGKLQQLKAMALFSLGEIPNEVEGVAHPNYEGYAIGDMLLDSYTKKKIALYFRNNGGRIGIGDKYSQSQLDESTLDTDPFAVEYPSGNGDPSHKAFSGVRNPTTQSIFGAYAPMPNLTIFKLPYELIRSVSGQNRESIRDQLRKRKKVERAYWPTRCGIEQVLQGDGNGNSTSAITQSGTIDVEIGAEIQYKLMGAGVAGNQQDDNDDEFGYRPHGVSDVINMCDTIKENTDDHIAIGETYLIGTAIAVCESMTSSVPWEPGRIDPEGRNTAFSKYYYFRVIEKGQITRTYDDGLAVHCDNPKWDPFGEKWNGGNGRFIYSTQIWHGRELYAGYSSFIPQRLAIGTVSNNRRCDVTEIGLKSKVYKQMTFANVNSQPDDHSLQEAANDKTQIQLGQIQRFTTRFSFFKLQARLVNSSSVTWEDISVPALKGAVNSSHLALFCVKGSSPEAIYNYITIKHPNEDEYEFRLLPYPGNFITVNSFGLNKYVHMLGATSRREQEDSVGTYSTPTGNLGSFTISFAGTPYYLLTPEVLSNPEWKMGDPNLVSNKGEVEKFVNDTGTWMSNSSAFVIPSDTKYVLDTDKSAGNYPLNQYSPNPYFAVNQYLREGLWCVIMYTEDNINNTWTWTLFWNNQPVARDNTQPKGNHTHPDVEIFWDGDVGNSYPYRKTKRRYKPVLNNYGGHPPTQSSPLGNPNLFYMKIEKEETSPAPKTYDAVVGTSGGNGSGLTVNLELWESSSGLVAARYEIANRGLGYIDGDLVNILPVGVSFPGKNGLQVKTMLTGESVLTKNINPYDVVSDWNEYEGDKSSHHDGPEHEVVYVNEIVDMGNSPAQYSNLAFAGIRLNSSKEWTNFTQLSAYFKRGIQIRDLIADDGSTHSSNLFPEIAYALLTNSALGAGELIGANFVDKEEMKVAAKFCKANKYFWDGVISDRVSLRDFIYTQASYCLLDFQIIGGRFSLRPSVPFDAKTYLIDGDASVSSQVKTLFTDGNIKDLTVSFLTPEERQDFVANVLYRKETVNGFPEIQSERFALDGASSDVPSETFDLSGFCTSPKQAADFAFYALNVRKYSDHGITFRTAPQYVLNLIPGDYFKLVSEVTHTSRFRNGAVTSDGTVVSKDDISGFQWIYAWKPGTERVYRAYINFSDPNSIKSIAGRLFTIDNATTQSKVYKLETLSYGEDGLIDISASFVPVENDKFKVLKGWVNNVDDGPSTLIDPPYLSAMLSFSDYWST